MFGVTLNAQDFAELIRSLHVERYVLAAELLSEAVEPLAEKLSLPVEEGAGFDAYQDVPGAAASGPDGDLPAAGGPAHQGNLAPAVRRRLHSIPLLPGESRDDLLRGRRRPRRVHAVRHGVGNWPRKLQATLWRQEQPIVLTSGTLAVGKDFSRFRTAAGLTGERPVTETVCPSPFDYQHNCLLYLPTDPIPLDAADYYDRLGRTDPAAGGGILRPRPGAVHFLPRHVGGQGTAASRGAALPVFTMGRRPARTLAAFRAATGSILLATGAAWEGLDFAGDGVSLLIIPRLPFAYPDAVKEKEREDYPNLREFLRSVVVPEMQIKLRQGFGRAIRTETDTCAVAMLDPRAARGRRYFQSMVEALPEMPVTGRPAGSGTVLTVTARAPVISGSPTQDEIVAFAASVRHSLVVLVMAFVMLSGYTCVANQEKEAVRHGADKGSLLPDPGIPACQGDGGARRGKPIPQRVHHGTTYQLL